MQISMFAELIWSSRLDDDDFVGGSLLHSETRREAWWWARRGEEQEGKDEVESCGWQYTLPGKHTNHQQKTKQQQSTIARSVWSGATTSRNWWRKWCWWSWWRWLMAEEEPKPTTNNNNNNKNYIYCMAVVVAGQHRQFVGWSQVS